MALRERVLSACTEQVEAEMVRKGAVAAHPSERRRADTERAMQLTEPIPAAASGSGGKIGWRWRRDTQSGSRHAARMADGCALCARKSVNN